MDYNDQSDGLYFGRMRAQRGGHLIVVLMYQHFIQWVAIAELEAQTVSSCRACGPEGR